MSTSSNQLPLSITTASGKYSVIIGAGLVEQEIKTGLIHTVIADERFAEQFENSLVIPIKIAEENKNLATIEEVVVGLHASGVRRKDYILVVGGGVTQDIGTLACSLFMRGVKWHYASTTLMAMTDSCIGGKSSINVRQLKNLIGNIYPPEKVVIDTRYIQTLDQKALASGLSEAAKICFCRGSEYFTKFLQVAPSCLDQPNEYSSVIDLSLQAKRWFIEMDEFDLAERKQLNFGHTFGHALEAATDFKVPHGVAIGVGMIAACLYAEKSDETNRLCEYLTALLGSINDIENLFSSINWEKFKSAFDSDKKHSHDHYSLILPEKTGVAVVDVTMNPHEFNKAETAMRNAVKKSIGGST